MRVAFLVLCGCLTAAAAAAPGKKGRPLTPPYATTVKLDGFYEGDLEFSFHKVPAYVTGGEPRWAVMDVFRGLSPKAGDCVTDKAGKTYIVTGVEQLKSGGRFLLTTNPPPPAPEARPERRHP